MNEYLYTSNGMFNFFILVMDEAVDKKYYVERWNAIK